MVLNEITKRYRARRNASRVHAESMPEGWVDVNHGNARSTIAWETTWPPVFVYDPLEREDQRLRDDRHDPAHAAGPRGGGNPALPRAGVQGPMARHPRDGHGRTISAGGRPAPIFQAPRGRRWAPRPCDGDGNTGVASEQDEASSPQLFSSLLVHNQVDLTKYAEKSQYSCRTQPEPVLKRRSTSRSSRTPRPRWRRRASGPALAESRAGRKPTDVGPDRARVPRGLPSRRRTPATGRQASGARHRPVHGRPGS